MANVEVVMSISKKAARMIKKGEAVLSSGGVRLPNGRILEQAIPQAMNKLPSGGFGGMNPISIVSGLGNNVQSAMIQKGVNMANMKLNTVIKDLGVMSNKLNCLNAINTLSWVNATFGLANCGIAIYGFKKTLGKLDFVQDQIRNFHDEYRKNRAEDFYQKYEDIYKSICNDLNSLNDMIFNEDFANAFENYLPHIEGHVREANLIMKQIKQKILNGELEDKFGCQMMFTLAPVLSEVVNQITALYYYRYHGFSSNYNSSIEYISLFDDANLKKVVKGYLRYNTDLIKLSMSERKNVYDILFSSVNLQKDRLETCKLALPVLTEEEYRNLDSTMSENVMNQLQKENPDHNLMDHVNSQIQDSDIDSFIEDENGNIMVSTGLSYEY